MQRFKIALLAIAGVASLTLGAEAGQRGHHFLKHHNWYGPSHHGCWYEYNTVPRVTWEKVRYFHLGKPLWRNVKKVSYHRERRYVCGHHAY